MTRRECGRPTCHMRLWAKNLCKKHYLRAVQTGELPPSGYTAATKSKAHLDQLLSSGLSQCQIAEMSGVNIWTIQRLATGKLDKIQRASEHRLLTMEKSAALDVPLGRVSTIGVRRRLQALVAIGHPHKFLADRLDLLETNFSRLLLGKDSLVGVERARAVNDLFIELQCVPGSDKRARLRAERRGWASPFAWDEETIDDPNAQPCLSREVDNFPELVADYRAVGRTDDQIAKDMGVSMETFQSRLYRHKLPAGRRYRDIEEDLEMRRNNNMSKRALKRK